VIIVLDIAVVVGIRSYGGVSTADKIDMIIVSYVGSSDPVSANNSSHRICTTNHVEVAIVSY
jgi:hypothetical protein